MQCRTQVQNHCARTTLAVQIRKFSQFYDSWLKKINWIRWEHLWIISGSSLLRPASVTGRSMCQGGDDLLSNQGEFQTFLWCQVFGLSPLGGSTDTFTGHLQLSCVNHQLLQPEHCSICRLLFVPFHCRKAGSNSRNPPIFLRNRRK